MNAVLVLVRVVQAGSFRGAAKLLEMPKTTVSRKLADLEARLGVQLLHRTTRQIALTDAGVAFVEEAEAALAHLEAAEAAVSELQREPRGKLRVTTTVPIGELLLAPIVAEFLEAYPEVQVALHLTDRNVDLVAERFDVAIRTGDLPDSSLVAKRLGASPYRVVASRAYWEQHGMPMKPSDLGSHRCLRFAKLGTAVRTTWPFAKGRRAMEVAVTGPLVSDDFVALRTAAERGLGVARLPTLVAHASIRSGKLIPALAEFAAPGTPLHLVHLGGRHVPPRTRAFLDFVEARIVKVLENLGAASPRAGSRMSV